MSKRCFFVSHNPSEKGLPVDIFFPASAPNALLFSSTLLFNVQVLENLRVSVAVARSGRLSCGDMLLKRIRKTERNTLSKSSDHFEISNPIPPHLLPFHTIFGQKYSIPAIHFCFFSGSFFALMTILLSFLTFFVNCTHHHPGSTRLTPCRASPCDRPGRMALVPEEEEHLGGTFRELGVPSLTSTFLGYLSFGHSEPFFWQSETFPPLHIHTVTFSRSDIPHPN